MADAPLVSVVTATFNMAQYLPQTIESILSQTHARIEAVVVDDGSTDDTAAVLERYARDPRVRVFRQQNAGQTVAKNRGISEARGEIIGFCDADDIWVADKLERQLPLFRDPGVGVVYGGFDVIDENGTYLRTPRFPHPTGRITGRLLADNFVHFPTSLVRREVIESAGGFDESLSMAIDYDLWLRISVDHDFAYAPGVLVHYRVWSGQMSRRKAERFDNAFRMMRTFLADHPDSVSAAERRAAWAHTYVSRGMWHAAEGRRREAWSDIFAAGRLRPWDLRLWRAAAGMVKPRAAGEAPR